MTDEAPLPETTKPFWKTSAVFWVSMALLPLVYWFVGSMIVGGMLVYLPDDTPTWARVLIALFGSEWTGEARSGGFNLVVGMVLGGIVGVYFGISVTQQKQQTPVLPVVPLELKAPEES